MEDKIDVGNENFKVGDTVKVKGIPGPPMTISCFDGEKVRTIWFLPGEHGRWDGPYSESFYENVLEKC